MKVVKRYRTTNQAILITPRDKDLSYGNCKEVKTPKPYGFRGFLLYHEIRAERAVLGRLLLINDPAEIRSAVRTLS